MTDNKNNSDNWKKRIKEAQQIIENATNIPEMANFNQLKETQQILENAMSIPKMTSLNRLKETQEILENAMNIPKMASFNQLKETQQIMENAMSIPKMASFNQLKETQQILENAMNIPEMASFDQIKKTQQIIENAMNIPEMASFDQIKKATDNVANSIPDFLEILTNIDLEKISFTENDAQNAEKIIQSDDIELAVSEELHSENKEEPKTTNSILLIVIIYFFMSLTIAQVDSFSENINDQIIFNTNIELNIALEKDSDTASQEDIIEFVVKQVKTYIFCQSIEKIIGIVFKKIKVYAKKSLNSRQKGELDAPLAVKIIKTEDDYTYIIHEDLEGNEILKGWILTSDIKKLSDFESE